MIYYATVNLLAGDDVTITGSSEDTLYVLENLYNKRPSKPFRFTGIGAAGNPEWVAFEFDAAKDVSLVGIFNHNLTALAAGDDDLRLKASRTTVALQNWANPPWNLNLEDRLVTGWNDLYRAIDEDFRSYRLEVIDTANPDGYVEFGEVVLAEYTALANAKIQPGFAEGPKLYRAKNVTAYGQDWTESLSHNVTLSLEVWNSGDPRTVDAIRTMIVAIHEAGGRFIIVPDHEKKFAYYVALENDGGFMSSIARGAEAEVTAWTMELQTLTKGITLL